MTFNFTAEISTDTIIGALALIIAIWSLWISYSSRRPKLEITDATVTFDDEVPFFSIWIKNTGNSSIEIKNFELLSNTIVLSDNGFKAPETEMTSIGLQQLEMPLQGVQRSDPFTNASHLTPGDSISYSYFIDGSIPNYVRVTANKRIEKLSHTRLIKVHFDEQ